MKKLFIPAICAVGFLVACGGSNACEEYVTAVADCYEAAGAELPSGYDAETTCQGYDNSAEDIYTCYTDAYTSGDCSTTEGVTAIAADQSTCGQ